MTDTWQPAPPSPSPSPSPASASASDGPTATVEADSPVSARPVLPDPPTLASGSSAEVLRAMTGVLSGWVDSLWAARPPAELLDTVAAVEGLRSVLDAVQLQVVVEVDARSAAQAEGWASTKDYLNAVTGGRVGAGRRLLGLAKAVTGDRSGVGAALAAGEISRDQAEAVVGVVDRLPANPRLRSAAEELLLEEARTRDAGELAKLGRYVLERLDPEGTERRDERALEREERAAHAGRFLSIIEDGLGGVRVRGRGTVEDAAHLTAVLAPLAAPRPTSEPGSCGGTPSPSGVSDALGMPGSSGSAGGTEASSAGRAGRAGSCGVSECAHDGRDPREHGTRMWDALVEAARLLAGTEVLPHSHGAAPRVGVTIDLEALRTGLGVGLIDTGGTLSAAAVRRLACDSEVRGPAFSGQ